MDTGRIAGLLLLPSLFSNEMNQKEDIYILAIESSCDDTSAAVLRNDSVLSNLIAGQTVHELYGGVVPELASRAHQKNIIPVVDTALKKAEVQPEQLAAIAYTRGPGLMGSLLVGSSFAKSMALALGKPLIEVNHMQAHIMAHFIKQSPEDIVPRFPFLCLTVSGGHTQLVLVRSVSDFEIIGQTLDDAAGEAFDKAAKIMGLPYPGGPLVDKLAKDGDPLKFKFTMPSVPGLDFSFSGLKTNFLYFLKKAVADNPTFVEQNLNDLCASLQYTVVKGLLEKMEAAMHQTGVGDLALAGGVSANSALRKGFSDLCLRNGKGAFIPPMSYCTDNAAMIGITAYYKFLNKDFGKLESVPLARMKL